MINCDDEWEHFCNNTFDEKADIISRDVKDTNTIPKATELYISTKTKIGYLNINNINLADVFENIPIIPYANQCEGIIKKQIKITFEDIDNFNKYKTKINENYSNVDIYDLSKNKIVKNIIVGISNKDLLSTKKKKKGAFYNCFTIIYRILIKHKFKEIHIKIFKTGKIEIPGVKEDTILDNVLNKLLNLFNNTLNINIKSINNLETILINSNFNCGFNINRENLVTILQSKYNISTTYDPCSYPGIMCKLYYYIINDKISININNINTDDIKNKIISFMIFRTGSILIVGKCSEDILYYIYDYLKNILSTEYELIFVEDIKLKINKNKQYKKLRQQTIQIKLP